MGMDGIRHIPRYYIDQCAGCPDIKLPGNGYEFVTMSSDPSAVSPAQVRLDIRA